EGLCSAGFVILSRVAAQILVELGRPGIEIPTVVALADRLFPPDDRVAHAFARRLAAAIRADVGFGGLSRSSSTRFESRSDRTIRSERFTTARATGRTFRIMKRVTSSCS